VVSDDGYERGTVKRWDSARAFGFIAPDAGGEGAGGW
jgi:cold shock CspA family protein